MVKHTFRYCSTHKEDEAYMEKMCARGWAAVRLVEGFWTFEPCEPGQFCYRVCYLRGKTKDQVRQLTEDYAQKGMELVSRYSFWAILRSPRPFTLYTGKEEKEICRQIYAPMPIGAWASWIVTAVSLILSMVYSPWFILLALAAGLYGGMCTWLGLSYRKLLKSL